MLKKILRRAPSVSLFAFLISQLGGCGDEAAAECTTDAQCFTGYTCSAGHCIAGQTPTAGASTGPVAGSATVGNAGTNPGTGGQPTSGGTAPLAGNSGVAGSVGLGGTGNQGVAGSNAQAGTNGTAGGNNNGGAGGMVMVDPPTTVGQCKDDYWAAANNGSVTRYDFAQGTSLPACTYVITHKGAGKDNDWDTVEGISTGDGGYFGAMNTTDYAQGAACGACVEASYNGKKVVLTIVDECPIGSNPVCTKGHIDLSRKAIRQLEPQSNLENLKGVSWHYVKCPVSGNAKARLHPNQNADWQPVVIENGLYPLKSVTLNGVNATRAGNTKGGNAWIATGQKAPYTVHATDVNNNAITFSYSGGSGLKDVGLQFICQ